MPNVEFIIGNKNYNIACDAGEEERIKGLAASLNVRVEAISKTFSTASDALIIAITALMMEDEIKGLKEGLNPAPAPSPNPAQQADQVNMAVINAIEPITKYIENLAIKLENS